MIRTQIYLEDKANRELANLANELGKSKSNLIREAIQLYIKQKQSKISQLSQAKGIWKNRDSIQLDKLRKEWNRIHDKTQKNVN